MSRLVEESKWGAGVYDLTAARGESCADICDNESDCGTCPIIAAFVRLAAYEDTGLSPEEVREQMERLRAKTVEPLMHDEIGDEFKLVHYICPLCGNIIDQNRKGQKTGLYRPEYCHDCGQHLEWRNDK